jgi:hypothetical protein
MPFRPAALGCALVAVALVAGPRPGRAEESPAVLDRDRPFYCASDEHGQRVRVQCDDKTWLCKVAPDGETDSSGQVVRPLERARVCPPGLGDAQDRPAELTRRGFRIVAAVADAPAGWMRDEHGRVFQVDFDLTRRTYFGAGWAPSRQAGTSELGRSRIDFGVLVFESFGGPSNPTRHRLRLVEGEVALAPFSADLVLAHYDLSRRFQNPLLRITTFFGRPRRHDATVNLGVWAEAGGLEVRSTDLADTRLWRLATTHLTLDLWQSADLESYVRLRGGVGLEGQTSSGLADRSAVTPGGAAEAAFTLDPRGFHHLGAEVRYERPRLFGDGSQQWLSRLRAEVAYEMIILAINDQPLTLRLDVASEKRDDIPGLADRWALVAGAGLRFSLWAPPRAH